MVQTLLALHIAAGTFGLLLGAVLMWSDTRRMRNRRPIAARAGRTYQWTVLAVCVTAAGLVVARRHDLWWLVPVAALTYGLALLGRHAAGQPIRSHAYVHGQGGSFIALLTALLVVALTLGGPLTGPAEMIPWVLPALLGTPLLELWRRYLVGAPVQPDVSTSPVW